MNRLDKTDNRFQIIEKIIDYLIILIIITLPFSIRITNIFIILAFLTAIINKTRYKRVNNNTFLSLYSLNYVPFLICVITLFYTKDLKTGLFSIEKYLPLIAIPSLFILYPVKRNELILSAFVYSICTLCLVALAWNFITLIIWPEKIQFVGDYYSRVPSVWNHFTHSNLTSLFNINPIYLSLYILFCILIVIEKFVNTVKKYILLLFLFSFLVLLSSRISIPVLIITLSIYALVKRQHQLIFIAIIFIGICFVLVLINPVLKKRSIDDLINYKMPNDVSGWNAVNLRLSYWECSIQAIKQSPLWGHGVGSQLLAVNQCYRERTWYEHFGTTFNSHNQYLEYALIGGAVLLGSFIIQLTYAFRIAWAKRDVLYILFLLQFILSCLTESMLETHKGIVYFAFFNALFLSTHNFPFKYMKHSRYANFHNNRSI